TSFHAFDRKADAPSVLKVVAYALALAARSQPRRPDFAAKCRSICCRSDRDRAVFVPFEGHNVRQHAATARLNQQLAKYVGERASARRGNMRHPDAMCRKRAETPLSRNRREEKSDRGRRFDDLQPQLRRSFFEQLHLLFAVALLVVLQTLVDVLVSPVEHAIDQSGQLVGHRGDCLRRTQSGAEPTVLGTEIALTPQQRRGGQPQRRRGSIDDVSGAFAHHPASRASDAGTYAP